MLVFLTNKPAKRCHKHIPTQSNQVINKVPKLISILWRSSIPKQANDLIP